MSGGLGTGRTTRQILAAPERARFVHLNGERWYTEQLLRKLGRTDLKLLPVSELHHDRIAGTFYAVVVDHAADELITDAQRHLVLHQNARAAAVAPKESKPR